MSIDLNYADGEEIFSSGLLNTRRCFGSATTSSETNTRQRLRCNYALENAAAFKYQKEEAFYDSFNGDSSCEKQKEIARDRWKAVELGK